MKQMATLFARSRLFVAHAPERLVLWFLLLELALLVCFCVAGAHASIAEGFPLRSPGDVIPVATLGVAALAVQNALPRLSGLQRLPTTVMTGNLTQSAIDLTRWVVSVRSCHPQRTHETRQRLRQMVPGVAGFFIGAATAAPMTHWFHFQSLWLACLALLATMPACIAGARPRSRE